MPKKVVLEFPVELPKGIVIGKNILKKAKEAFVLELLRKGKISQGKAAEALEIDRHDLFDLMNKHDIPVIDMPEEKLKEEFSKEITERKRNDCSFKFRTDNLFCQSPSRLELLKP